MIVTTKQLFEHAYGKYALGAYNINNAEQTMGLFRGCMDSKAPFIIQISKGARSYTNKRDARRHDPRGRRDLSRTPSSPSISTTATRRPATTASRAGSTAPS